MTPAHLQRGSECIEIVFELQQQRFRRREQIVLRAHEIRIEMLVRAEDHRDLVFGVRR